MAAGIPKIEIAIYFVVWSGCFYYSMMKVNESGNLIKPTLEVQDFERGWRILKRDKDVSDYEWTMWTSLTFKLIPWIIIHISLCEFIRSVDVEAIPLVHFIVSISVLVLYFSVFIPIIFISQFVVFLIAMILGSKRSIWCCAVLLIVLVNFYQNLVKDYLLITHDELTLMTISLGWFHIRCIDFTLAEIDSKTSLVKKMLDFLGYAFYLPCFFLGPFIPYDTFKQSLYNSYEPWTICRFKAVVMTLLKIGFWYFVYEILSHFLYCHSMHYQVGKILSLGVWTVNGVGLCMAQFFYIKYVVIYGFSSAIAKAERYNAPPSPKCINRIHLYSEMWRHFDRGFYLFMFNCIYQPVCGHQTAKLSRRLYASFLCFCFVFLWHGINLTIFIWSVLNFLGVAFEAIGKSVKRSERYKSLEAVINPRNVRRFEAMLCSPLWVMAVVSNFVFFGGHELGMVYVKQVLSGDLKILSTLFLIGYCMCQVSVEASLYQKGNERKKEF